ncbi:MAG: hypothetical protein QM487_04635 [Candidatus Marithrix sp.]
MVTLFTFNWYYVDTGQLLDLVVIQNIEDKTFSSSKENYLIDKESTVEKLELNNFHRVRFVSIPDNTILEKYNPNEVPKVETKYFLAQVNNPIDQVSYQKLSEPELIFKGVQTSSETIALKLEQCEQYFNANHLTTGKQGTALDCYQQILILNPTNILAKKGLDKIEQRYQQWAETAINKGNFKKAHIYIKRLQKVNPKSTTLSKLRQLLARSKISQTKNTQRKLQSSNKKAVKKSSHPTKKISKRCNDIFFQESLGIRALTSDQKRIKQQHCK